MKQIRPLETNLKLTLPLFVTYQFHAKGSFDQLQKMTKTIELAKNATKIILCLGEKNYTETPGDISNLYISESQTKLALALSKLNIPIILILNEGRPRLISQFEDKTDDLYHFWFFDSMLFALAVTACV